MDKKLKIALAQLNPLVDDVSGNIDKLISIRAGLKDDIDILVAPELYVSGYPIDDLVLRNDFLELVENEISDLAKLTSDGKAAIILGSPRKDQDKIRNSVFVLDQGKILSFRDKHNLPNTGVFDEQRIFTPGSLSGPVKIRETLIGLPICEDIWNETVIDCLSETGAEIIISINASPYTTKKIDQRMSVAVSRVFESKLPLIYLNRVGGQDELVFDGSSFCLSDSGELTVQLNDFKEEILNIDLYKNNNKWNFQKNIKNISSNIEALYKSLVVSVRDYVHNNGFPGVVLGMSGGIDSALVAAIATDALGPNLVKAVMMPSPYTSKESLEDSEMASSNLGIDYSYLDIKEGMNTIDQILLNFNGPKIPPGITEENIQEKINLFQQMQQQAQALNQQTSQIEMSVNEIERTLNEIEDTNDKSTLYRAIGSIMQKVDNVKKLKKELMDEKETLEIRNKSLKGQVENLNVQINGMQSKLTPIVQSLQENKNQDATQ